MKTARHVMPTEEVMSLARPLIARACHRSGDIENPEAIEQGIRAGEYALLLLEDGDKVLGVCVLQNCGDYLHVLSVGGRGIIEDIGTWFKWWARIARHLGFKALSLNGRKGWEKVLSPFGFKRNGNNVEVVLWA